MWFICAVLMVFSLENAVTQHTYQLKSASAVVTYAFDVRKDDDNNKMYEVRTEGTSEEQPFGTTTDLVLRSPRKSIASYSTHTVEKFVSSDVQVVFNGDTATLDSRLHDDVQPANNRRVKTTIHLLKGSTDFVVWEPVLLPEMLSDGTSSVRTCIRDGAAFPLVLRAMAFPPPGVPRSAKGINATCGSVSAEIWYDAKSRLVLDVRSIDGGYTWRLKR